MKTLKLNTSINTLMSVLIAALVMISCSKNDDDLSTNMASYESSSKSLSDVEKNDLRFMVEKAKLMKNVYQVMHDTYQTDLFKAIADCKEKHMILFGVRLSKYDVEDPTAYMADDQFASSELQQAYDDFIAERPTDLTQSMLYLKGLEEDHIACIETSLAQIEGNGDIVNVYNLCLIETQAHLDEIIGYTKGFRDIIKPFDPVREL